MSTTEDLQFLHDTLTLELALKDAKEARDAAPDDEDAAAAVREAKDAVRAHRQFWRQIRDCAAVGIIGAPEAPAGDAVASPDTHGMGASAGAPTAQEG